MVELGLTQDDVITCLNVSRNTVSAIFTGKRELTGPEIAKLSDLLDITDPEDIVNFFIR